MSFFKEACAKAATTIVTNVKAFEHAAPAAAVQTIQKVVPTVAHHAMPTAHAPTPAVNALDTGLPIYILFALLPVMLAFTEQSTHNLIFLFSSIVGLLHLWGIVNAAQLFTTQFSSLISNAQWVFTATDTEVIDAMSKWVADATLTTVVVILAAILLINNFDLIYGGLAPVGTVIAATLLSSYLTLYIISWFLASPLPVDELASNVFHYGTSGLNFSFTMPSLSLTTLDFSSVSFESFPVDVFTVLGVLLVLYVITNSSKLESILPVGFVPAFLHLVFTFILPTLVPAVSTVIINSIAANASVSEIIAAASNEAFQVMDQEGQTIRLVTVVAGLIILSSSAPVDVFFRIALIPSTIAIVRAVVFGFLAGDASFTSVEQLLPVISWVVAIVLFFTLKDSLFTILAVATVPATAYFVLSNAFQNGFTLSSGNTDIAYAIITFVNSLGSMDSSELILAMIPSVVIVYFIGAFALILAIPAHIVSETAPVNYAETMSAPAVSVADKRYRALEEEFARLEAKYVQLRKEQPMMADNKSMAMTPAKSAAPMFTATSYHPATLVMTASPVAPNTAMNGTSMNVSVVHPAAAAGECKACKERKCTACAERAAHPPVCQKCTERETMTKTSMSMTHTPTPIPAGWEQEKHVYIQQLLQEQQQNQSLVKIIEQLNNTLAEISEAHERENEQRERELQNLRSSAYNHSMDTPAKAMAVAPMAAAAMTMGSPSTPSMPRFEYSSMTPSSAMAPTPAPTPAKMGDEIEIRLNALQQDLLEEKLKSETWKAAYDTMIDKLRTNLETSGSAKKSSKKKKSSTKDKDSKGFKTPQVKSKKKDESTSKSTSKKKKVESETDEQ